MKAYITFLGRSIWAVLNSYHAVLKEKGYQPDLIYLIIEDLFNKNSQKTHRGLEIISEEFNFSPEIKEIIVEEARFVEAGKQIKTLIKELKNKDYKIAVDLTPGRKALVAATLLTISNIDVDHVFYLALKILKGASLPYEMIPRQIQNLKDFIEEAKEMKNAE
ncbi:MAG: hypothetical protein ACTSVY_10645 [Candidatus Helarchaeota archaeon]